jgi:tripartite-type tricarboxylate transporter receptor subunit TctC
MASALPFVKNGQLQALAVGTPKRSPELPNVPTTVEAGYANSEYTFWVAMLAPAGTPKAIIDKLNADVVKALNTPEMKEKLKTLGAEPFTMAPAQFDAFLKTETAHMAEVVKAAHIQVQ